MSDSARSLYAAIAQIAYPARPEIADRYDNRASDRNSGEDARRSDIIYPAMNKGIPGVVGYDDEPDPARRNAHNAPIEAADRARWVSAKNTLEEMLKDGSAVAYNRTGAVSASFWMANYLTSPDVQLFRFTLKNVVTCEPPGGDQRPIPQEIASRGKPARLDYRKGDKLLASEMHRLIMSGQAKGPMDAARVVVSRAEGTKTEESKVKRLTIRYNESQTDGSVVEAD